MNIRPATISDLQGMQNANLTNLPENYALKYYLYQAISWPHGSFVATVPTSSGSERIVGYVMAKIEDENVSENDKTPLQAHIISISVMRSYRRMGVAKKLLRLSLKTLYETFNAKVVSLHVRESNKAALHLYRDSLGFEIIDIESKYYADGEDAYSMKADLEKFAESSEPEDTEDIEDLLDISKNVAEVKLEA